MRRSIALLLIPLCLAGTLGPHLHCGGGALLPTDNAARPHIHVGGSGHHRHSHLAGNKGRPRGGTADRHGSPGDDRHGAPVDGGDAFEGLPPFDHDSDAVYITDWTAAGRGLEIDAPECQGWRLSTRHVVIADPPRSSGLLAAPRREAAPGTPEFLRNCSLQI